MKPEFQYNQTSLGIKPTRFSEPHPLAQPRKHVNDAMDGLGFLDKINLQWRTNKEIVSQVEASVISLLRKQAEAIEYQMILDLDAEKKHRFCAYLKEVGQVEQTIIQTTQQVVNTLTEYLMNTASELIIGKNERSSHLDNLLADNKLTQDDAEMLRSLSDECCQQGIENLKQKIRLLMQQHEETYTKTLQIMKTKVLETT